ncbi:DUF2637 domain-containing protein [Streptomyces sp. LP05-1]|uniref:DUF2637 domain-containing protein n=1 Tax=Streptomyces pyxinae TaxID=2970734 RepID=A0ABT2CQ53_9ACTN|nr:DUF2637 domain-containing protein [Streptomyces sp. LP05-1]MCS0639450.1 DUF2637 domain-containing protein [Streptomyces sp. LP05-1]
MQLTRTHKVLIGVVIAGALVIAGIGFAGSYAAVRELALSKGFGDFSLVFPIGIDAGICVLLALDLLLTWLRIPFPLLRQTAWLLTAATIAFNGAAAWPDPLGVGMHAVIPVLFVVAVEAARHAVGRIADITADKHMEGVRLTRWLLSPVPTFRLWRRMKLWELRSYEQVIKLEQDRMIYQARLQARFGRAWRRKAPVEALMPLRLAKFGVPLAETAPAGLAAAGVEPVLLPPGPRPAGRQPDPAALPARPRHQDGPATAPGPDLAKAPAGHGPASGARAGAARPVGPGAAPAAGPAAGPAGERPAEHPRPAEESGPQQHPEGGPEYGPELSPTDHESPWFATPHPGQERSYEGAYDPSYDPGTEPAPPTGPGPLPAHEGPAASGPDAPAEPAGPARPAGPAAAAGPDRPAERPESPGAEQEFIDRAYEVYRIYADRNRAFPSAEELEPHLRDAEVHHPNGSVLLRRLLPGFQRRVEEEQEAEHIA